MEWIIELRNRVQLKSSARENMSINRRAAQEHQTLRVFGESVVRTERCRRSVALFSWKDQGEAVKGDRLKKREYGEMGRLATVCESGWNRVFSVERQRVENLRLFVGKDRILLKQIVNWSIMYLLDCISN